jgi:hypothetical protein
MGDAEIQCSRGHRLWLSRLRPGKCPLYGCEGDVDFGDDGLSGVREPRVPYPPSPVLQVAEPRPGEPVVE